MIERESGYKVRKAARLAGKPITGRSHESAPWYTWGVYPGPIIDGRARVENELTAYGLRVRSQSLNDPPFSRRN